MKTPPQTELLRFDRGTLLLERSPPKDTAQFWKWDHRAEAWRCDALHYSDVAEALREEPAAYRTSLSRNLKINFPRANLHELRPDQEEALSAWMPTRRGVLVMPTGTGKTEVALHIMHRLGVTALVVAPVRDLMYQWHQRIQERLGERQKLPHRKDLTKDLPLRGFVLCASCRKPYTSCWAKNARPPTR